MAGKKVIVDLVSSYAEAIKLAKIGGKRTGIKHYTANYGGLYQVFYFVNTVTPKQNVVISIKELHKAFKNKY